MGKDVEAKESMYLYDIIDIEYFNSNHSLANEMQRRTPRVAQGYVPMNVLPSMHGVY